jgi:hypothetical protein
MSQRVARSLTLLWALVATAAIVLAIGGVVLGSIMSQALRQQSLDDTRVSLSQYTSGVLSPRLVYGTQLRVGEDVTGIVRRTLAERPDILSVKVWRRDGVLAWASLAPDRIGQRFPVGHDLQEVFESGEAEAGFEDLADAEDAVESRLPVNDLIEVYAPVISGSDEVIGAYEVYADATPLEASGSPSGLSSSSCGSSCSPWPAAPPARSGARRRRCGSAPSPSASPTGASRRVRSRQ